MHEAKEKMKNKESNKTEMEMRKENERLMRNENARIEKGKARNQEDYWNE